MFKKIIIACILMSPGLLSFAQEHSPGRMNTYSDESPVFGLTKENLFAGGGVAFGYNGWDFNAGITPEIGYTLASWFDAGVLVNLNYTSERADPYYVYNNDIRQRSFNYGIGAFARIYPVNFLFFQLEPEYNWVAYNAKDMSSGETASVTTQAASFLAGIGYSQRIIGRNNFYIAVMFDLLSNQYSPYRDYTGAALPVVKVGFDFYLHPRYQR
ncbi:MAG TPA: hypothetical protein VKR32_12960 [Puia sp.]|nr:hypothetical protein [Puia sp.]